DHARLAVHVRDAPGEERRRRAAVAERERARHAVAVAAHAHEGHGFTFSPTKPLAAPSLPAALALAATFPFTLTALAQHQALDVPLRERSAAGAQHKSVLAVDAQLEQVAVRGAADQRGVVPLLAGAAAVPRHRVEAGPRLAPGRGGELLLELLQLPRLEVVT